MVNCSILGCKSRSERKCATITFHSFPKIVALKKLWVSVTGRPNWSPTLTSRVCSKHFTQKNIRKTDKKTFLKIGAAPTIEVHESPVSPPITFTSRSLSPINTQAVSEDPGMMSSSRDICLVCLRIDRKLKTIPFVLSEYHDELTDYMNEVSNPKYCCECEYLLRKTYNFHKKCKLAAKILIKWHRIKNKNKPAIDQLYLKLPVMHLDTWTPENSKVYVYNCTDMPDLLNVKEELVEETEHNESLFKVEIHCEDEKITGVSETIVPNLDNDLEHTKNVFQNKLTDDLTTSSVISSNSIKNKENEKIRNEGYNISQSTNIGSGSNTNDKIDDLQGQNDMPSLNDMSTLTDDTKSISTICDDELNDSMDDTKSISTVCDDELNDSTDDTKSISTVCDDELNDSDDPDLICLDDDKNETILIDDDDIEYPDDASLNSDDDCDDYLIPPSPKKRKMKRTLDQIANITLSDEDFDDDYVCDKQKITKRTSKVYSNDKVLSTENNIATKLENMAANLNDICENWEITCLQNVGMPKVSYEDVKKVTLKLLTENIVSEEITKVRKKFLKKKGLYANLADMSANLDFINQNSIRVIEDYENGLQDPKERLKEELKKKFDTWGELKSNDGIVFDKEVILKCVDMSTKSTILQLISLIQGATSLNPGIIRMLKCLQNKQRDLQYASVFDMQYLGSDREILEEFERRKTYECYVNAKFKCDMCFQGFMHKRLLEYHMKFHDVSGGRYECSICRIRCPTKRAMQKHRSYHSAVFKCKMCPLVTYYRLSMVNHYEQHKGTRYECKLCGAAFKSKSVFVKHRSNVHKRVCHACTFCGGAFTSPLGLNIHMQKKHRGEIPSTEGGAGIKCNKCQLVFPSQEVYDKHDRTMHGAPQVYKYKMRKSTKPRKKPTMTCKVCNATGHSRNWLCCPYSTEHPDLDLTSLADKQRFLCDVCGKGFSHKYKLRDHIGVHTGVLFPCVTCSKQFPTRPALRVHALIHAPPGFCCERCGKKFHSYANLYNHMRTHIGDRRFKCNICSKGFLHRSSLKEHVRGVHNLVRRARRRGLIETGISGATETEELGSEIGTVGVCKAAEREVSKTGQLGSETGVVGVSETGVIGIMETEGLGSDIGVVGVSETGT